MILRNAPRQARGALSERSESKGEAGQTVAELALVLPIVTLLVLGLLQLGLLGYASVMARYAAFTGVRASAIYDYWWGERAAQSAVAGTLAHVPGVRLVSVSLSHTPLPLRDVAAPWQPRRTCRVRVSIPRLLPAPYPRVAEASCALLLEPSFE